MLVDRARTMTLEEINKDINIRIAYRSTQHKLAIIDYTMAITKRTRVQCNTMIYDARNSVDHGEKARRLLWDKHKFAGMGQRAIYVVTIDEAIEFLD
eukprot:1936487-Rhodomonas_salina.1